MISPLAKMLGIKLGVRIYTSLIMEIVILPVLASCIMFRKSLTVYVNLTD